MNNGQNIEQPGKHTWKLVTTSISQALKLSNMSGDAFLTRELSCHTQGGVQVQTSHQSELHLALYFQVFGTE